MMCSCRFLSGYFQSRCQYYSSIAPYQSSTKTKSMAMCGNYIQRVKVVINDNNIEHVLNEFKYLVYPISQYKSDLEDKLQNSTK